VLAEQTISIDEDPPSAFAELRRGYHENPSAALPELPPPSPRPAPRPALRRNGTGITIAHFNQQHDVEDLISSYGARPARKSGLYFCPFHPNDHASLQVYSAGGKRYVHCLSKHSDCPLARHGRNDPFNVYCVGEGLETRDALRKLNGRG
jgi:hypothetical protein